MPRLLVNENFPAPATRVLREHGVDVLSVQESMPGGDDASILQCAVEQGRWLVTFDRDYGELVFARDRASPPAIVYLRQEPYPPAQSAELVLALLSDPSSAEGHFVVVSQRSVRRRALPRRTG